MCHVDVNNLADFLWITELSELATEKIIELLQRDWSVDSFIAVAETLQNEMRSQSLQKALGILAANHISELITDDRFTKLGILTTFAVHVLQNCATIIEDSEKVRQQYVLRGDDAAGLVNVSNFFFGGGAW